MFMPAKIEQRADRGVSAICVIVPGESKLKPVSEPLLNSDIQVVAGHRSGVDNVETHCGRAKFIVRSGHHFGPRLKEDSRMAIHVKSLTSAAPPKKGARRNSVRSAALPASRRGKFLTIVDPFLPL
jgi:hypothetical protein